MKSSPQFFYCNCDNSKSEESFGAENISVVNNSGLIEMKKYFYNSESKKRMRLSGEKDCVYGKCGELSKKLGRHFVRWEKIEVLEHFDNLINDLAFKKKKESRFCEKILLKKIFEGVISWHEEIVNVRVDFTENKTEKGLREINCSNCGRLMGVLDQIRKNILLCH